VRLTAPGAKLSATIAVFSAALQRRRRGVPVNTSMRRKLHRNQLYAWRHAWRRELRSGAVANAGVSMPDFVPVVAERRAVSGAAAIEIEVGGAVVRAGPGVDLVFLGEIVRLLQAR
jgi:transposase-like protein